MARELTKGIRMERITMFARTIFINTMATIMTANIAMVQSRRVRNANSEQAGS